MYFSLSLLGDCYDCCKSSPAEEARSSGTTSSEEEAKGSSAKCCRKIAKLAMAIIFALALSGMSFSAIFFTTHLILPSILVPIGVMVAVIAADGTLTMGRVCISCCKKMCKEMKEVEEEHGKKMEEIQQHVREGEEKRKAQAAQEKAQEEENIAKRFQGFEILMSSFNQDQSKWVCKTLMSLETIHEWKGSSLLQKYLFAASCLPPDCTGIIELESERFHPVFTFYGSSQEFSMGIKGQPLEEQGIDFDAFVQCIKRFIETSEQTFLLEEPVEGKEPKSMKIKDLTICVPESRYDAFKLRTSEFQPFEL